MIKISIITPSFNQGAYIEQTILSVLEQEYPNKELIVIDGGSTDNTVQILEKYADKITYWVSEPDKGQAHAINKGLEHVTGDVVNWINSDDYLEEGALQAIADAFETNSKAEIVCGYTRCFWDEDKSTSHVYRMGLENCVERTMLNIKMNQPGTFYKTSVFRDLNGVNENLRYVFDNELWIRYLGHYNQNNVVLIPNLLAQFRQHDKSKSFGEGFEKFHIEKTRIWLEIGQNLGFRKDIITCMVNEFKVEPIQLKEPFSFTEVSSVKIEAYWCNRYLYSLRGTSKKTFFKLLFLTFRYNMFSWTRKNIMTIIKKVFSHA